MDHLLRLFVRRLASRLRAHQLERLHRAESACLADKFPMRLPLRCTLAETFAEHVRTRTKIFLLDRLQHRKRGFAGRGISAERSAEFVLDPKRP